MTQANRDKLIEDSQFTSARASETARYIAFGLLAIYYTAFISGEIPLWNSIAGVLGAVAVLLDYVHYLVGHISAEIAIEKRLDGWPKKSPWRIWRYRIFWAKQVVAFSGAVALIMSIVFASSAKGAGKLLLD